MKLEGIDEQEIRRETDVARPIVNYFRNLDYRVYNEVQTSCGRADLVAKRDDELIVVEAKTKFSFSVVAQANRWRKLCTKVYIATPARYGTGYDQHNLLREILVWRGIGWFTVRSSGYLVEQIGAVVQSNNNLSLFNDALVPEQETGVEAGSSGGGYYTKYRGTCMQIAAYARDNPGASIDDVLKVITHHYKSRATARSALSKLLQRNVLHGVRGERSAAGWKLYVQEETDGREAVPDPLG